MEGTFPSPEVMRVVRLVEYWSDQDVFWRFSDWPMWARQAMLLQHKVHDLRYNLVYFFVGNGMYPEEAIAWIKMRDAVAGVTQVYNYDSAARDDFDSLQGRAAGGELFTGKKLVFDMRLGRPVLM